MVWSCLLVGLTFSSTGSQYHSREAQALLIFVHAPKHLIQLLRKVKYFTDTLETQAGVFEEERHNNIPGLRLSALLSSKIPLYSKAVPCTSSHYHFIRNSYLVLLRHLHFIRSPHLHFHSLATSLKSSALYMLSQASSCALSTKSTTDCLQTVAQLWPC